MNKYLRNCLWISMTSVFATQTWAATVVERRDSTGKVQTITIDAQNARLESKSEPDSYMLMDLQAKKMYLVNTKEKRVVTMGNTVPDMPNAPKPLPLPKVESKLVKIGDGAEIAGFPTVHYQVTAEGKVCSDDYFSEKAAKVAHIQVFNNTMLEISTARKKSAGAMPFAAMDDPCKQAQDQVESDYLKLGMPMKSVSMVTKENTIWHEVISIKTDVVLPSTGSGNDFFALPKDYKVVTEQEMMKAAQENFFKKLQELQKQQQNKDAPPPLLTPLPSPQQPPK